MLRMRVASVKVDSYGEAVVILEDLEGKNILPIWIGHAEAFAIKLALEKIEPPRPMTHDLLKSAIESLNGKVKKICIVNLENRTFYATITLQVMGSDVEVNIDARPSDAIALALRTEAPIYAAKKLLESPEFHRLIDPGRILGDTGELVH